MLVTATGFTHFTREKAQMLLARSNRSETQTTGTNLFVIGIENDENHLLALDEHSGKFIDFHVEVSFNMDRGSTINFNDPGTKMKVVSAVVFSPCTLIITPEQQIGYTILGQDLDLNLLLVFNVKTNVYEILQMVDEMKSIKNLDNVLGFDPA